MNRFDRQERITGWDQSRFARACVVVYGRGWLGTFTAWALASLGIGRVLWVGPPQAETLAIAEWFLTDPPPINGVDLIDFPCRAEYEAALEWALLPLGPGVFICCAEDSDEHATCATFARRHHLFWLAGRASGGGGLSQGEALTFPPGAHDPIAALAVAALLADAAREYLCPLQGGLSLPEGALGLGPLAPPATGLACLVGVGGIGVYAATALAAKRCRLHLIDHDRVERSNLNRQGLFRDADAREQTAKALAAQAALGRWFPRTEVTAEVKRVVAGPVPVLDARQPTVLLSAVDNAQTRVLLQTIGRQSDLPVVQAGTDTFAADCFTQGRTGPLLDEQMHGALSEAARRETQRDRQGGCAGDPSYVVPGMLAGALLAHRCVQLLAGQGPLPPIRWRTGSLPVEQRCTHDGFDFTELAPDVR